MVGGSDAVFDVSVADCLDIIRYQEGDSITLENQEGSPANTVTEIKQ